MRAIAANLKMLVQCPALWFWHLIGAVLLYVSVVNPLVEPAAGEGAFMRYLLLSYWGAIVLASLMRESLSRPFAFCLPRHRTNVRITLLAAGVLLNGSITLIVFAHPDLSGSEAVLAWISAAMLGLAVYLTAVAMTFVLQNSAAIWGFPLLILWLGNKLFVGLPEVLEGIALSRPGNNANTCFIAFCIFIGAFWKRRDARDLVGGTFLPMQYLWNRTTIDRYNRKRKIEALDRQSRRMWLRIESAFLSRMKRLAALSGRRHAAGSHYSILGAVLPSSLVLFVLMVAGFAFMVVVFSYIEPEDQQTTGSLANIGYYIPALLGMSLPIPLYTPLLLPAGRGERFRTCLVHGAIAAAATLAVSMAVCGISHLSGVLLPEISLAGNVLHHHPADPGLLLIPLVPLPLLLTCQFLFPKRAQIPQTLILIVTLVFTLAVPGAFAALHPVGKAVLLILAWWCFVGPLHHYCYHRDLALQ